MFHLLFTEIFCTMGHRNFCSKASVQKFLCPIVQILSSYYQVTSIFTPNIQQMNLYLQTNFLVNGLFKSFVIDYGPNLAFTICCPKRSGNFHSGLTNIKPVKKQKHNLLSITYFRKHAFFSAKIEHY